jgi:uncharacterized protein YfbU (UPF0304 family)|tara:strand:- start:179 stop:403 length:225 start_codon:yes stop_codon:yes gene_type:complete
MTIESQTDLDIRVAVSDCFNANSLDTHVKSAYQLLQKYLRQTHGFTYDQVDEVVDRIEEQVAEHIISIHEEQNA